MKRTRKGLFLNPLTSETDDAEMSPVTNLSQSLDNFDIFSCGSTPKRRLSWASNSPSPMNRLSSAQLSLEDDKENSQESPSNSQPSLFDSPMDGILRENRKLRPVKRNPLHRFYSLQVEGTPKAPQVARSQSDVETSFQNSTIMMAVQKSDQNPNLVGDFSKDYSLPLIPGKHPDIKTISCITLRNVLRGEYDDVVDSYMIVDCRYPYEYEGGHIIGAKNIYSQEGICNEFFCDLGQPSQTNTRKIVVFHCEFSSERGPKLYRYLRNEDRERNKDHYPLLHYPEIYLLEGGYKAFYEQNKEFCEPREYVPMTHKDYGNDLRYFRAKSKSWTGDSKGKLTQRPGLKF